MRRKSSFFMQVLTFVYGNQVTAQFLKPALAKVKPQMGGKVPNLAHHHGTPQFVTGRCSKLPPPWQKSDLATGFQAGAVALFRGCQVPKSPV
jgi:hypothetical protein